MNLVANNNRFIKWLVVSLSLALLACEKPPEVVHGPRPALVMTVQANYENDTTGTMAIVGEVKARYDSQQGFRVAGKIIKRFVDVGDSVKKGDMIAQLDSADAKLALKANQADVTAAQAQVALAKANLTRNQQLLAKKFIAPAALDQYETAYQTALARLEQTRAQANASNNQSDYTQLYADRNGIVNFINAEPGQVVNAGQVVVQIIDPKQLEVHISLAESRIAQLKVNDMAVMRLWAAREKAYPVKVREINPVADAATRTFLVKLTILAPDDNVRLGMTAGVMLNEALGDVILIPSPAVITQDNQTIVWRLDAQNQVHRQVVQVFSYREDGVLISNGLNAGDQIVVAGAQALVDQQVVRPIER